MNCKVRFAPSPTGYMHIGNARVAIINYLFAKKKNGHFLFRLDDTDRIRSKKEYEDSIIEDLSWLGIQYDSTFRQIDRFGRYDEVKNKLIDKGVLYKCYETEEELAYKRKQAISKGIPPVYDRASLLNPSSVNTSNPCYYRFKLPRKTIAWNDIVFGQISYDLSNVSDPVVIKADGAYLYTMTSIIDDLDFDITHIIRGQDHITNTAVQIAIFEEICESKSQNLEFAHLSLLVNKDGSKFSKRLGSLNLENLRSAGIESITIIDMMATLGSSLDTVPFTDINEIIKYFDLTKFGNNSPKFDIDELFKLNKKVLHNYSYEKLGLNVDKDIFNLVHNNIERRSDFEMWKNILSDDFENNYFPKTEIEKKVIVNALELLDEVNIESWIEKLKEKMELNGKELYMPIRLSMTGFEHGPNITEIAKILGNKKVCLRLKKALSENFQKCEL